ncbi:MAG: helix-turn-helix domain-containing protein [Candidatus Acidiferrum sp.]
MKVEYRDLSLKQLGSYISPFENARPVRPHRGWLRAMREALGISRLQVAQALRVKPQSIMDFEEGEKNDSITLSNLRRVADAMGCDLVYLIVPKTGTIQELAEKRTRDEVTRHVNAVEHTMGLENQTTGNTDQLIDQETKRRRKKA